MDDNVRRRLPMGNGYDGRYNCPACGSPDGVQAFERGVFCHACGADAVDMAADLWGLAPEEAAQRLIDAAAAMPADAYDGVPWPTRETECGPSATGNIRGASRASRRRLRLLPPNS